MGRFREYKICDMCGGKIETEYVSVDMVDVVIDGDDDKIEDRHIFDLCSTCATEIRRKIIENPLPKFGDE